MNNHYDYLEKYLNPVLNEILSTENEYRGMIAAHGDKCRGYKDKWKCEGIPFNHGALMYLMTYISPWSKEVRETIGGEWVAPFDWVVENYNKFKEYFPPCE